MTISAAHAGIKLIGVSWRAFSDSCTKYGGIVCRGKVRGGGRIRCLATHPLSAAMIQSSRGFLSPVKHRHGGNVGDSPSKGNYPSKRVFFATSIDFGGANVNINVNLTRIV